MYLYLYDYGNTLITGVGEKHKEEAVPYIYCYPITNDIHLLILQWKSTGWTDRTIWGVLADCLEENRELLLSTATTERHTINLNTTIDFLRQECLNPSGEYRGEHFIQMD